MLPDHYDSIAAPTEALFVDRASKFYAYAFPVSTEDEIKQHLDALCKSHIKAGHHCFAWRLGTDHTLFRAQDDGEPSGTAGKPILGQIDAFGLTDVLVVVVRYFGGTLLGTSGLINAYRSSAKEALGAAERKTHYLSDTFSIEMNYVLQPVFTAVLHKIVAQVVAEEWLETSYRVHFSVRKSLSAETLDKLKAGMHGLPPSEASGLDWPVGLQFL